jgi:hypothetical protein
MVGSPAPMVVLAPRTQGQVQPDSPLHVGMASRTSDSGISARDDRHPARHIQRRCRRTDAGTNVPTMSRAHSRTYPQRRIGNLGACAEGRIGGGPLRREDGIFGHRVDQTSGSQRPLTSRPSCRSQEERLFPRSPQADRDNPGRTRPTTCSVGGRAPNRRQRLSILRRDPGDHRRRTRSS